MKTANSIFPSLFLCSLFFFPSSTSSNPHIWIHHPNRKLLPTQLNKHNTPHLVDSSNTQKSTLGRVPKMSTIYIPPKIRNFSSCKHLELRLSLHGMLGHNWLKISYAWKKEFHPFHQRWLLQKVHFICFLHEHFLRQSKDIKHAFQGA